MATWANDPRTSASANCQPRKIQASAAIWGERFVAPKRNAIMGVRAAPFAKRARPAESAANEQDEAAGPRIMAKPVSRSPGRPSYFAITSRGTRT